ncbi:MAG: ABC transporter ATP-binding protein [Synergistaceae bacterium]|nr:ABC transporter ATP-binding protein [Synergistaceae bacterium]
MNLGGLLDFAGKYKIFAFVSWILAGVSALIAIIPVWYIWQIIICAVFNEGLENISHYGVIVLASGIISILLYLAGLIFADKAASKIADNLRDKLLSDDSFNSGEMRRIIIESSDSAKNYVAFALTNKFESLSFALGLVGLLLFIDWKFAAVSLAPLVLGFVLMARMAGESLNKKLSEYNQALNLMSAETVEYVKSVPVMKMFGQSEHALRRIKHFVDSYEACKIAYSNELRLPMMIFTLAMNGVFIFLIAAAVFVAVRFGVSREFLQNFILAVIAAPLTAVNLTRSAMQNNNAVIQINKILALKEAK